MSGFLLDTMVASVGFSPGRHPDVAAWLADGSLIGWFSTITLGEIQRGIVLAERCQPAMAARLNQWFASLLLSQAGQFLPVTSAIAARWGRLSGGLGRNDPDLLIAATALEHDLTVATRNVRHFAGTGVRLFNPWTGEGWDRA